MSGYTIVYYSDSLSHHGIKGQKWGRRRWQNEDGSLTEEGKARYGTVENFERAQHRKKVVAGVAIGAAAIGAALYLKNRRASSSTTDLIESTIEKIGDKPVDKEVAKAGSSTVEKLFTEGVIEGNKAKVDEAAKIASFDEFRRQMRGESPRTLDLPDFNKVAPIPKVPISNSITNVPVNNATHKLKDSVVSTTKNNKLLKSGNMVVAYKNKDNNSMAKAYESGKSVIEGSKLKDSVMSTRKSNKLMKNGGDMVKAYAGKNDRSMATAYAAGKNLGNSKLTNYTVSGSSAKASKGSSIISSIFSGGKASKKVSTNFGTLNNSYLSQNQKLLDYYYKKK